MTDAALPTDHEVYLLRFSRVSMTVLEAMAPNHPAVGSRIGGTREQVEDAWVKNHAQVS